MSIWDTLIGLAATALHDKPRRDVLLAVLNLRERMVACQKTYDDYQTVLKEDDYDVIMERRRELPAPTEHSTLIVYDPRDWWESSVSLLAEAFCEADPILNIFSPNTSHHVLGYFTGEVYSAKGPSTANAYKVLERAGADIDLTRDDALGSKFRTAVRELDSFIRENFKPEEVFAARKRVEVFPSPFVFCGEYWLRFPD